MRTQEDDEQAFMETTCRKMNRRRRIEPNSSCKPFTTEPLRMSGRGRCVLPPPPVSQTAICSVEWSGSTEVSIFWAGAKLTNSHAAPLTHSVVVRGNIENPFGHLRRVHLPRKPCLAKSDRQKAAILCMGTRTPRRRGRGRGRQMKWQEEAHSVKRAWIDRFVPPFE